MLERYQAEGWTHSREMHEQLTALDISHGVYDHRSTAGTPRNEQTRDAPVEHSPPVN